jgi:hypothetical protein
MEPRPLTLLQDPRHTQPTTPDAPPSLVVMPLLWLKMREKRCAGNKSEEDMKSLTNGGWSGEILYQNIVSNMGYNAWMKIGLWSMNSRLEMVLMSLVLVYAETPTIFANFHTFIRLYLIIFHCYITTLHCTSTLHLYIALLCCTPLCCNSASHFYAAPMLHCYHLTPSHCHCLMLLHVSSQVLGPSQVARSITP